MDGLDPHKAIWDDIRATVDARGYKLPIETFTDYLKTINWTEPWLMCLCLWHIVMFLIIMVTRKDFNIQSVIGLILLCLVYVSETINEFARENWRLFAKEQYFDEGGLFMSTVFGFPALFNCLMIVVNFLVQNCILIKDIQTKKADQIKKSMSIKDADKKKGDKAKSPDKKNN